MKRPNIRKHIPTVRKKRQKIGLAPGSLVFTGKKYLEDPHLTITRFNEEVIEEQKATGELFRDRQPEKKYWYDLRGIHDGEMIQRIGTHFGAHPLVLEDIMDPEQRPKIEEYDDGIFIIIRALSFRTETLTLETEQVSLYLGNQFVWSFQEKSEDLFAPVRERLQKTGTRLRRLGTDYLAYALLDYIVDNYYLVLDEVEATVDRIEDQILENPTNRIKADIHQLRQQSAWMRKSIAPLREAVGRFSRLEHPLIENETQVFIRDLYDHVIQVMDQMEAYRDIVTGLYDLHQSEISMRMNNVMQTLTIITTIFVPLGFLAGVYGMNFDYMPELKTENGYYYWWAGVSLLVLLMLYLFRRNKWL